jgi:phospholipase/lecithinase/hemolysin
VTDPKGVGNPVGVGFLSGPLTQPVVTQIANFAADNGSANFSGTELITVLAGPNDLFGQTDKLQADATAAGGQALVGSLVGQLVAGAPAANQAAAQAAITQATVAAATAASATPTSIVTAAITAALTHAAMNGYTNTAANTPTQQAAVGAAAGAAATAAGNTYAATTGAQNAVAGMTAAATTLAGYVKDMVNKGAKYVVVVNIPDVSQTPMANKTPSSKPLILAMTSSFNASLQTALAGTAGVVFVDAFTENKQQFLNPAQYGLTNVTDVACNLNYPANPLDATGGKGGGSSLACNKGNLIAGDTSFYLFADDVHPTPYGHRLLAQYVTKALVQAGWL